jgi:uncharacterized protein YraI
MKLLKLRRILMAILLLIVPSAAFAARGIVTTEVSMRAGPGTGFPVVDRIPAGAHVVIHGCIRDESWCDVSWNADRGWVSAEYLRYYYRNRYVYLPEYVDVIDVPIVPFAVGTYWAHHYAGRPFYHRRAYWNNYWQSHAHVATRPPLVHSPGVAVTVGRGAVKDGRGARTGFVNERALREGRFAHGPHGAVTGERQQFVGRERGAIGGDRGTRFTGAPTNGREAHGRRGEFSRMHPPVAGPQQGGRFSAAPTNTPVARPDVRRFGGANAQRVGGPPTGHVGSVPPGRVGGVPSGRVGGMATGRVGGAPLQSNAQAPAPRTMGAMPHGGGMVGGARMGGAPNIGGGVRAGGAPAAAPAAAAGAPGRHR